jgi:hypothetical protein
MREAGNPDYERGYQQALIDVRADRLDRFAAAALSGLLANSATSSTDYYAAQAWKLAAAILRSAPAGESGST